LNTATGDDERRFSQPLLSGPKADSERNGNQQLAKLFFFIWIRRFITLAQKYDRGQVIAGWMHELPVSIPTMTPCERLVIFD